MGENHNEEQVCTRKDLRHLFTEITEQQGLDSPTALRRGCKARE